MPVFLIIPILSLTKMSPKFGATVQIVMGECTNMYQFEIIMNLLYQCDSLVPGGRRLSLAAKLSLVGSDDLFDFLATFRWGTNQLEKLMAIYSVKHNRTTLVSYVGLEYS